MLIRSIEESVKNNLYKGKIIIIYGARQVGKTTLIKKLMAANPSSIYLNCDEPDIREALTNKTSTELKNSIGNSKFVCIDEAQRVHTIGLTLKLLHDNYPDIQLLVTGSSSFELSDKIVEPLTGRKIEYSLYPFSIEELKQIYQDNEIKRLLEQRLIWGMYPDIVNQPERAEISLKELTRSYLYKDILAYQNIKNPDVLEKLLQNLALQLGSEVSYTELATSLGIDKKTVEHYVRILEQSFIIFRLKPYSKNIRNELKKMRKIYFFDTGIRNMLINNLNPVSLRQDIGALWENFVIAERLKSNSNKNFTPNTYFWRTHAKQEIDYIEEHNGKVHAYEIKWNKNQFKFPEVFISAYPKAETRLINQENFSSFCH